MVGLSKADVRRTFNTYAIGKKAISVDESLEMFRDMDEEFPLSEEQFKEKFHQFDENGDNELDFEECWKLYKNIYPDEEY